MLLKSSIFLILILNIYFSDIRILFLIFVLNLLINFFINKNLKKHLKILRVLLFFYFLTFTVQLFYAQEGEVLLKIYNLYITKSGIFNFSVNFIRLLNLILISWLINEMNIFKNKFKNYQNIIETVIDLVPQVFTLIKKRMKLKYFYRHILKEIKNRN